MNGDGYQLPATPAISTAIARSAAPKTDGLFGSGPAFYIFDGHHLEMEDMFAFSLAETQAAWEQDRYLFRDFGPRDDVDLPAEKHRSATTRATATKHWTRFGNRRMSIGVK